MLIDFIFVVLMVIAIIKGFQRGLILVVFSIIAFIIGIAAAVKLSTVAANYIGQAVKVSDKWLPVISFAIVFIIVVLLVRIGAKIIEKTFQLVSLGWLNRFGGILFFVILYIIIYSILLFYAHQIRLLKPETMQSSATYSFIQPWGPKVIDAVGKIIPIFKDMFTQLENFFGNLSHSL